MSSQIIAASRGQLSPVGYRRIDVTSHAKDVFRQCSPFYLGPIPLYDGLVSKNLENAWQYSKVYPQFTDKDGYPTPEYFEWAYGGFRSSYVNRHPMGWQRYLYHWWDGQKLSRAQAKRIISLKSYCEAVMKTEAYAELKRMYDAGQKICLIDYDGFDYEATGLTPEDLINDDRIILGQSFMLKWALEGIWQDYLMIERGV